MRSLLASRGVVEKVLNCLECPTTSKNVRVIAVRTLTYFANGVKELAPFVRDMGAFLRERGCLDVAIRCIDSQDSTLQHEGLILLVLIFPRGTISNILILTRQANPLSSTRRD